MPFFFLFGVIFFVSGAPFLTKCKIPSDMNIHYETLTVATIGNKFLMPAEYISSSANQTEEKQHVPRHYRTVTRPGIDPVTRSIPK